MDKGNFDRRYQDLVLDQIDNFGRKVVNTPKVGHVGCAQVTVELPPESIAALKAIGERNGSPTRVASIRIAGGLRADEVLRSELSIGAKALNG